MTTAIWTHLRMFLNSKFYHFCLSRCYGAWTVVCTLQYRPWTGSIKPSLQHLQLCCVGLSLGILIFSILPQTAHFKKLLIRWFLYLLTMFLMKSLIALLMSLRKCCNIFAFFVYASIRNDIIFLNIDFALSNCVCPLSNTIIALTIFDAIIKIIQTYNFLQVLLLPSAYILWQRCLLTAIFHYNTLLRLRRWRLHANHVSYCCLCGLQPQYLWGHLSISEILICW
jgi:hypothetical protein